jgi:hypothetical protein
VTGAEALDGGPAPSALLAVTVKVYAVPLTRPVTFVVVGTVPADPLTLVAGCAADPMYGVTV